MSESRFTGRQVLGIVIVAIVLLAVGLVAGGLVGYQWGRADGSRQVLGTGSPNIAQVPRSANPRNPQLPLPFNGQPQPSGGPYLGVQFEMITPALQATEGLTGTTGAIIRSVVSGSPADQAGLKTGEVITAVDGQPVDANNSLLDRVQAHQPGDEITLTVVTPGANGPQNSHDVKATLGSRPDEQQPFGFQVPPFNLPGGNQDQSPNQDQPQSSGPYLGIEYEMLTPELAASEGITGTTGAIIRTVVADSPAAAAQLQVNQVITAVDGQTVDDQHQLRDLVQQHKVGDQITLTVVNGSASGPQVSRQVTVTLAARPAERQFQLPPGTQPGAPGPSSRSG
jgi:membrane-associated protease RseP (regulator of RpoE activity)